MTHSPNHQDWFDRAAAVRSEWTGTGPVSSKGRARRLLSNPEHYPVMISLQDKVSGWLTRYPDTIQGWGNGLNYSHGFVGFIVGIVYCEQDSRTLSPAELEAALGIPANVFSAWLLSIRIPDMEDLESLKQGFKFF